MEYPALAIQTPNVVGNFLGGMQTAQDMQAARVRNQLLMQQQEQQAQAMQRDEQFRNILAQSVGPMAADAAQPTGSEGANYLMQGMQNPLGGDPQSFADLVRIDPERAFQAQAQLEQMRAQREADMRQRAGQAVRAAQFVAKSSNPKRTLEIGFPDMVEQLKAQGVNIDELDDNMVKAMAGDVIAQFGPIAGIGPAEPGDGFTLGEGQVRFDAQGNEVARGPAKAAEDKDPNDKMFARTSSLRKEFDSTVEGFRTIRSAYENVQNAQPNDAGDTQLVLNYMRVISPGIRIQPGERIDDVASVPGVPQGAVSLWNKIVGGGKLNDGQRDELRAQAKRTYDTQRRLAGEQRSRYSNLATMSGLDVGQVVGDDFAPVAEYNAQGVRSFASVEEAEAAGLKPGTPIIVAGRKARWE